MNRTVGAAFAKDPASRPALWTTLRVRWEYGHAAGFVQEVLGLAALIWSVLEQRPAASSA